MFFRNFIHTMGTYKFGPHNIPESQIFYYSKLSLGLVNLKPVAPGHILLIPRRHALRFTGLTTEEVTDLMTNAQQIGKEIERIYKADSLTFAIQDGPAAGQTVPHAHIHIIPRRFNDWANNDDIYDELEGKKKPGVDNDERKPRSEEEMRKEAEWLREFFPNNAREIYL